MMKQCRTCMNREFKDKLTCCAVADLFHAFREILKCIPFFGKDFKTYECGSYMADNKLTGFPDTMPPMCRCHLEAMYEPHGFYVCPTCGNDTIAALDERCKECGQPLKWEHCD